MDIPTEEEITQLLRESDKKKILNSLRKGCRFRFIS